MKTSEAYLYIQLCLESCLQTFSQAVSLEVLQGTRSQQTSGDAMGGNYVLQQQKLLVRQYFFLIMPTA